MKTILIAVFCIMVLHSNAWNLNNKNSTNSDVDSRFENQEMESKTINEWNKLLFSVGGGLSYRFAKIADSTPSEFKDYMRELRWGENSSYAVLYFLNESYGFGLRYNTFQSDNKMEDISMDVDGDGLMNYGRMVDDMKIKFVGPVFSGRKISQNGKNAFISSVGIGYISYKNNAELAGFYMQLKGKTLGLFGGLTYRLGLSDALSLGVELSYTLGTLKKYERTSQGSVRTVELDKDEYDNLGRLELSLGLLLHP